MPEKKWYRRWWVRIIGVILLLFFSFAVYLALVAIEYPPDIADRSAELLNRERTSGGDYRIGASRLRKSSSGLYELYVEGADFERGVINGKLTVELVQKQEELFNAQIGKMIPSKFYLHFLKYFVGWFNRDLAKSVSEEYKREIYGVSLSASHQYDYIGSPYQRILNYHAAHDIGHALQNLALVGCTSFATWDTLSEMRQLIIGRNFDFYVGDGFAEDKIVGFFKPDSGYGFMTVTWGGFLGAVSGMNEKGLSITINAAKSGIPSGAATPVSLVAREILQYAATIDEAYRIASTRKMFVSESFLVGSAHDSCAVIIEKTPDRLDMYRSDTKRIVCSNHFQSESLESQPENKEQEKMSASVYRYQRVQELLDSLPVNTVSSTAAVLRNRYGLHGKDIGNGNEKAINQLIAHHSVIFSPYDRKVWVSTHPWQLGQYVCYDLSRVLDLHGNWDGQSVSTDSLNIPEDPFLQQQGYRDFITFHQYKLDIFNGKLPDPAAIVRSNPNYYHSYVLAGKVCLKKEDYRSAMSYFEKALQFEVATQWDVETIRKDIAACREKLNL
ncbi:MAG: C45 family peptidase [Bacteroidia bacterium]